MKTRMRHLGRRGALILLVAGLSGGPAGAAAPECGQSAEGFTKWLESFRAQAMEAGISGATLERTFSAISYDRSVIAHDRGQKVFHQSFEQFSGRMVNAYRLRKGHSLLKANAALFRRIEGQFGVPGPVLVAIWGLETDFGAGLGTFRTLNALATLAYDCRRAAHFRDEFLDALQIVQRGDLQPESMRGAWAGEIGQTQMMPSGYLAYALDYDGNGRIDLIHDTADVLASTAHFLQSKGWQKGEGWNEGEPNFEVLLQWNKAHVYARTIALFAQKLVDGEAGH